MEQQEGNLMDNIEEIKKGNSKLATHSVVIECEPGGTDWACGLDYDGHGNIFDMWTGEYLDRDLTAEEKKTRADRVPKKRFYVAERKNER